MVLPPSHLLVAESPRAILCQMFAAVFKSNAAERPKSAIFSVRSSSSVLSDGATPRFHAVDVGLM